MNSEDIKYVIIQAGGKGIRMGRYAENKPKCLVEINSKPLLLYNKIFFNRFKNKLIVSPLWAPTSMMVLSENF